MPGKNQEQRPLGRYLGTIGVHQLENTQVVCKVVRVVGMRKRWKEGGRVGREGWREGGRECLVKTH